MINYIRNKQIRIIGAIRFDFIREKYLMRLESGNRLVGLIGQRGVGKTTLLLQYLKKNFALSEYLYFSADDAYLTNKTVYDIADEFVRLGGKVIVIDEIHKYTHWAQELKNIYDAFPDLIIRFSGSSMLEILEQKYDLSRRAVIVRMDTLTFREYMQLSSEIDLPTLRLEDVLNNAVDLSTTLALEHPGLYKNFRKYLRIGYYPFFKEDEQEYNNKLFNALDKIIYEDIPAIKKVDYAHLSIFKKLIAKLIYSRVPMNVNVSELGREFGISHPTVITYIDILEKTKVIRALKKYSKKLSKKPNKILFANPNILHTFAEEFGIEADIGSIRESYFVSCFDHIYYSDVGDFRVADRLFEIGGKGKSFAQIREVPNSYLAIDTDYTTQPNTIPLWLFGLMGG